MVTWRDNLKKSRMNVTSSQSEFQIRNLILNIFPQKHVGSNDSPSLSVVRRYILGSPVSFFWLLVALWVPAHGAEGMKRPE